MKTIIVVSFLFTLLSLLACRKERNFVTANGSSGTLLVKAVQKTGTDSVIVNYSYDASKRLVREKTSGISQGTNVDNDLQIIRSNSGVIIKTVQKAAALVSAGIDSVITIYHYDAVTSRYTSSVLVLSLFGLTVSDSMVYRYDAGGKIIRDEIYQAFTGSPYDLSYKDEYHYSAGGNVDTINQSSYDVTASTYDLVAKLIYTFDNKVNVLMINTEAIVLGKPSFFGVNNAIKTEYNDVTDPTNNFTDNIVYIYNSSNRPQTGVSTETPSGTISNLYFYYQ